MAIFLVFDYLDILITPITSIINTSLEQGRGPNFFKQVHGKKLHWLPVRYRVQFKIGLITYKILTQGQPVYLRGLIHPYTSFRNTRQSTKFLQTPTFDRRVHKSIKHFSNSFSHYAPSLRNSFPLHVINSPSVASFRNHLKTHLFSSSFPI